MSQENHENHVLPLRIYFLSFGALLFLTLITVGVSRLGLPPQASIAAAMGIAVVKATVVAAIFMHLKYGARFHVVIFLGSLVFVFLFFLFTFVDFGSRDTLIPAEGTLYQRHEVEREAEREAKEAALKAATAGAMLPHTPAAGPAAEPTLAVPVVEPPAAATTEAAKAN